METREGGLKRAAYLRHTHKERTMEKKNERLYIAYGSNLNVGQMRFRCPRARLVGTAEIEGWRLLFRRGYLTIEKAKGHKVPVGIWSVTPSDERSLDRYEGYPNFYVKRDFTLDIATEGGVSKEAKCFAYIMADGFSLAMPTDTYFITCSEGYDDFGFDHDVLERALVETYREKGKGRERFRLA